MKCGKAHKCCKKKEIKKLARGSCGEKQIAAVLAGKVVARKSVIANATR